MIIASYLTKEITLYEPAYVIVLKMQKDECH